MNYSRVNLLGLLEILKKYSDESYILSIDQIQKYMEDEYGISPDRRSIYKAIDTLIEFGYDISKYKENGKGYFLRDRMFETSEISMLSDMIVNFKFVDIKYKKDIDRKLQSLLSIYKRKEFKPLTDTNPETTREIFLNIEILQEAILNKMKVSFVYLQYDLNKKLVPRKKELYVVNPFDPIVKNSKYYLICSKDPYTNISFYRLDLIKDLKILEKGLSEIKDEDIKKQIENSIYAFSGSPERIILKCKNEVIDYLIEEFGNNINIERENEEYFTAEFNAPTKGLVYWALQFLEYVEVVEPTNIREEIIRVLNNNSYKN